MIQTKIIIASAKYLLMLKNCLLSSKETGKKISSIQFPLKNCMNFQSQAMKIYLE